MTPERLLDLPAPIAQLTDEQLTKHLTKYFPHTRPKKPGNVITDRMMSQAAKPATSKLEQLVAAQLAAQGLDAQGKSTRKFNFKKP